MKTYNIYNNVGGALAISIALSLGMTSCDDQIMEWKSQGDSVTAAEIPLAVKEVLANYDDIKAYAEENHPNMTLGLGIGMNIYMGEDGRRELSRDNFQMITWGNAMKMDAIVKNNGSLNFANLDPALDALQEDGMKLYGHNFIWHTQQNQTYLKSLIAPKMVIDSGDDDKCENIVTNSGFEDGNDSGWNGWEHYSRSVVSGGHDSDYALKCEMDGETSVNYDCQLWWSLSQPLEEGVTYYYGFWVKSPDNISVQLIGQNSSYSGLYKKTVTAGSDWTFCEGEFTYDGNPADVIRIGLQFGGTPNSVIWVDDFKFGPKKDQTSSSKRFYAAKRRAGGISYEYKTPEEKAAVLTDAMEAWIKGMAEHLNEKGIVPVGYDVINEAIADGSNKPRGYDGVFGGSVNDGDGNVVYDKEPQEGEEYNGLNLNWGSGHFYWGYYVPDYAVKAFQFARQYLPAETKLFYNDYNLETSPGKLAAVVDFVNKIDADNGSPIVDGIGSQMHITLSGTNDDADNNNAKVAQLREQVDAMFQTLAATGKLVRVTELDISLGTSSPSAAQYKAQSDAFRTVFESYFENVPEAQQSGITIWSLTDAEDEHEYWLKGQTPNLFDAKFKRKWAYKGVCDALAGEDLGLQYGGEDYKAYYEKQNVSETVK